MNLLAPALRRDARKPNGYRSPIRTADHCCSDRPVTLVPGHLVLGTRHAL